MKLEHLYFRIYTKRQAHGHSSHIMYISALKLIKKAANNQNRIEKNMKMCIELLL